MNDALLDVNVLIAGVVENYADRAHPGTAPKLEAAVGRNAAFMRQG